MNNNEDPIKQLAEQAVKNAKAVLKSMLGDEVVLRSELDAQNQALDNIAAQLDAIEKRLSALESALKARKPAAAKPRKPTTKKPRKPKP